MRSVKVSSITYVKNGVNYIEKCIKSIMNQSLKEIEIIVVDGGSTDGTVEVINRLCKIDSRIVMLNKEGSVGAQFNSALNMASGEYVAVCEGDDYILPNKYETQYEIAKSNKLDILRACYFQFFEYGGKEYRYKVETGPSRELYDQLIEVNDDIMLALGVNGFWNGLYNRRFLIENDIYMNETRGASYQDISFSFLSQAKAKRVWFMSEAFHCYRIDNPNASVNSSGCIELHFEEYRLLKSRLFKNGMWDEYQKYFMVWEIGSFKHFIDELDGDTKDVALNVYDFLDNQKIVNDYLNVKMPQRSRKLISALYTDKNLFLCLLTENKTLNNKALDYFKTKCVSDRDITLFGCGHFGCIIFDFLKLIGKNINIVDNNVELQKKRI